ncbi:hypothetical protein GCM10022251_20100 [Phytohabitans flavus]|uniref:Uncharacterized protein n=1 Tax=Phytohabitans flavus TaxID=1076124 RepID=A0A6F8XZA9_9ACTN|nr:hypothetical protein [Phytohabitans flavus]BCB79186.1 hypothetical protein Pflav_055960 [Phytohabitans flavus]
MSDAAPARRVRGRLRGRLAAGLAFLAVLAVPGSVHAAPPPDVSTPVGVCVEVGLSTEIDAAAVVETSVPVAAEPRAAQAPVPAERVTADSADRSAQGQRAPPQLVR